MKHESRPKEQAKRTTGRSIRRLRKQKRLTLQALAAATGRSVGFLSQVERGLSDISVRDLRSIAEVLDLPLSWFFINEGAPPEERDYVVRANARGQIGSSETGLVEELLSPDLGGSFEVFRSVFAAGAEMKSAQQRNTEEAGYVVSGEFDLWLDKNHFHLRAGDSFRFNGEAYRWRNLGDQPAIIIWVISPPIY